MIDYMVEFTVIGDANSQEFQALVPSERARIGELLESGEIKDIWLKEDYTGGYFLAYKKDEEALQELFASLPLLPHLNFEAHQLKKK